MNIINLSTKIFSLPTNFYESVLTEIKTFTDVKAYRDEIARYESELRQNATQIRIKDSTQKIAIS